ncbi:hypothetical protein T439DRAFT_358331 [Meredithblackwellia eburnea MCA 4105]
MNGWETPSLSAKSSNSSLRASPHHPLKSPKHPQQQQQHFFQDQQQQGSDIHSSPRASGSGSGLRSRRPTPASSPAPPPHNGHSPIPPSSTASIPPSSSTIPEDITRPTLKRLTDTDNAAARAAKLKGKRKSSMGGTEEEIRAILQAGNGGDKVMVAGLEKGKGKEKEREVIVHQVSKTDTIASISLQYGITPQALRTSNRLWATDSVHLRKTLHIPLDLCDLPSSSSIQGMSRDEEGGLIVWERENEGDHRGTMSSSSGPAGGLGVAGLGVGVGDLLDLDMGWEKDGGNRSSMDDFRDREDRARGLGSPVQLNGSGSGSGVLHSPQPSRLSRATFPGLAPSHSTYNGNSPLISTASTPTPQHQAGPDASDLASHYLQGTNNPYSFHSAPPSPPPRFSSTTSSQSQPHTDSRSSTRSPLTGIPNTNSRKLQTALISSSQLTFFPPPNPAFSSNSNGSGNGSASGSKTVSPRGSFSFDGAGGMGMGMGMGMGIGIDPTAHSLRLPGTVPPSSTFGATSSSSSLLPGLSNLSLSSLLSKTPTSSSSSSAAAGAPIGLSGLSGRSNNRRTSYSTAPPPPNSGGGGVTSWSKKWDISYFGAEGEEVGMLGLGVAGSSGGEETVQQKRKERRRESASNIW